MQIHPVAVIHTDFKEKFGIPRQSGRVPQLMATITFLPPYAQAEAVRGIEGFSHLWLIFDFSLAHREEFTPTVRPPRLGGNTKMGVFATRSPFRPNSMGLSCVKLVKVNQTDHGPELVVSGADLLDGTPIYDIKPYLPFADSHPEATAGFAGEHEHDGLQVVFPEELSALVPEDKREALIACLAEDPRPSYQDDGRSYGLRFGEQNIKFFVKEGQLFVTAVE